jgi:hypothetical protein
MAGLVPAIHAFLPYFSQQESKTWMPATNAGMTEQGAGQRKTRATVLVAPPIRV